VRQSFGHIPNPNSPEWPIAWAAKEVLRRYLGPKFGRRRPSFLATAIVELMRHAMADHQRAAEPTAFDPWRMMAGIFIDRTDPTFDDLGRRRVDCLRRVVRV